MKRTYILIIAIIFCSSILAQSPVVNIEDKPSFRNTITDTYYKDINNFMNPFEGTWIYTNGNTTFKIVLRKEAMLYTGKFYKDYIKGEYQYIENGVEIANTLLNTNQYSIGVSGSTLLKPEYRPVCNDCPENERRIRATIYDRITGLNGTFTLKLTTVNGQPAIEGYIWGNGTVIDVDNPPEFTEMVIPTGTFIFIKE
ncbi:DUF6705 family protein [Psychroserpens sp.]